MKPSHPTHSAFYRLFVITILLTSLFISTASPARAAGEPTLSITDQSVFVTADVTTLSVPILFDDGDYTISSVSFRLDYDASCVRLDSDADITGEPVADHTLTAIIDADNGRVDITLADQDESRSLCCAVQGIGGSCSPWG